MAYLVLVTLISGGFIVGMKLMGKTGYYLAGPYMLGPAIAAIITRLFFYKARFKDAPPFRQMAGLSAVLGNYSWHCPSFVSYVYTPWLNFMGF